ncbi:MAG TPA: hypothetical protein VGQ46_08005 [Thermoanaerobaculia bacterium]|jgi:hypothetical protein|nr:hypothetical protein [Thermoanaerobaculia bacterium]
MALSTSGIDPESLFGLVGGLGFMLLIWSYDDRFRKRAKTHDHVAEVGRNAEIAIPPRCLGCGSHHASHPVEIRRYLHGVSPITQAMDPSYKRRFTFHCCLDCARPIRRRRRLGRMIMAAGYLLGIHVLFSFVLSTFVDNFYRSMTAILPRFGLGWLVDLRIWSYEILGGTFLVALGFWMTLYSPYVTVLDTGGRSILFWFRNQHYRDAFAELNGEEVAAVANR